MHDHPHDHVVYVMNDARFRLTFSDGKSGEFDLRAGHGLKQDLTQLRTLGQAEGHNLVVEVKK